MIRLEFTDDLLTGINEIDNQHRELLARGNAVLFPGTGMMADKTVVEGLDFLIRYVNSHFAVEEELMEYYGYDRLEGHRKQHLRLRREVENLSGRINRSDSVKGIANELYFLLNDWYIYHIKEWDKVYAVFLQGLTGLDEIIVPGLEDVDVNGVELLDSGNGLTSSQLQTLKKLQGG